MFFKKILPQLNKNLESKNIIEPNEFQKLVIPKIKAGTNINILADKGAGKTTVVLINVINKLKYAQGDNPRVIFFVKNKAEALELEKRFSELAKGTDLRVYPIFEEQQIDKQKDAIYLGVDVVIGTPKRLAKLYYLNGLNLRELKMFIIANADGLESSALHSDIIRISESINKCQYLIYSQKHNNRIDRIKASIIKNGFRIEDVKG
jgi:superfamily II DNA/RNA helicase